jgi:hypothetical protein
MNETKKARLFKLLGQRWMTHIDALELCGIYHDQPARERVARRRVHHR